MSRSHGVSSAWSRSAAVVAASLLVGCGQKPQRAGVDEARQYLAAQSTNPNLMQFAMTACGWIRGPAALDLLREGLASPKSNVRNEAIDSLVRRGDPRSAELLVEALAVASGAAKLRVAQGLARLSRPEGRPALVDNYLGSGAEMNAESAARAIAALAVLDPEAARPFAEDRMKLGADDRAALYPVLAEIEQPWARELVVRHVGADADQTLDLAIMALGARGGPEDAPRLAALAEKAGSAKAALDALGRIGGDRAGSFLEASLARETNPVFLLHAAAALWRLGKRDLVRERILGIVNAAGPETKAFQRELADALAEIDDPETIGILITLYKAVDDADKPSVLSLLKRRSGADVVQLVSSVLDERRSGKSVSDYILASYAIETLVREAPTAELLDRLRAIRGDALAVPYTRIAAAAGEIEVASVLEPGA